MSTYIHNNTGSDIYYFGVPVPASGSFLIPETMLVSYANNDELLADIVAGTTGISLTNSAPSTGSDGVNLLKGVPAVDSEGVPLVRPRAFASSDGFRARFKGIINGTATKNTTTNLDYLVSEERFINGVRIIVDSHVFGDSIGLQVVDVDNILGYGAGLVLDTFGESWYLDPTTSTQPDVEVSYPAKISAGLYIRAVYTSTGTVDDVSVILNAFLHKAPT